MAVDESEKQKKEVIDEARHEGRGIYLRHQWIFVISRIWSWNLIFQKVHRESCAPR